MVGDETENNSTDKTPVNPSVMLYATFNIVITLRY